MKVRKMPVYEKDAVGNRVKRFSAKFYAVWMDFSGAVRRLPLFESKSDTQELANQINKLDQLRASCNRILPPELARCVEDMPDRIRRALVEWDILPAAHMAAGKA